MQGKYDKKGAETEKVASQFSLNEEVESKRNMSRPDYSLLDKASKLEPGAALQRKDLKKKELFDLDLPTSQVAVKGPGNKPKKNLIYENLSPDAQPDHPCTCGSGKRFKDCHGLVF